MIRVELPDLFDLPAPSVPTRSSEAAADRILRSPLRRKSWRQIMIYLASKSEPVSREAICEATGIPQHVACARIWELRPTWIEAVDRACVSSARVQVDGYRLTSLGRARVRSATAEDVRRG